MNIKEMIPGEIYTMEQRGSLYVFEYWKENLDVPDNVHITRWGILDQNYYSGSVATVSYSNTWRFSTQEEIDWLNGKL